MDFHLNIKLSSCIQNHLKRVSTAKTFNISVSLTKIPPDTSNFCTNQLGFKPNFDQNLFSSKHQNQEIIRYLGMKTFTRSFV